MEVTEAARRRIVVSLVRKIQETPVAELPRNWDDVVKDLHIAGAEFGVDPEVTELILAEVLSAIRAANVADYSLN